MKISIISTLLLFLFNCNNATAQIKVNQLMVNKSTGKLYVNIQSTNGFNVSKLASKNNVNDWSEYYDYNQSTKKKLENKLYVKSVEVQMSKELYSDKNRYLGIKVNSGSIYNGYIIEVSGGSFEFETMDGLRCRIPMNIIVSFFEYTDQDI